MKALLRPATAAALLLGVTIPLPAVPVLNYQGRILVGDAAHSGPGYFKFALVDATAAETFWTSDGTGLGTPGAEPASPVLLNVDEGLYQTLLGAAPMPEIPPATFANNEDVRLRLWFSTAPAGPFELLTPDQRLSAVGYAFSAQNALKVAPGYDTGDSGSLGLTSISQNKLTFTSSFTESFGITPTIDLAGGWTIDAVSPSGFTATAGFTSQPVDSSGAVGSHTSIAVIDGRPAVSYRDIGGSALRFLRARDAEGTTWPASGSIRVDGALDDSGLYSSLAEVAGRPAISYYRSSTGDLQFVRADDAAGTSWPGSSVTVDGTTENVGWYTSLAVVGGVPAIAYYAPNAGELRYAWAADAEGTVWPSANVAVVDGSGAPDRGRHCSLVELGGKPAIAYQDASAGQLLFAYLSGADPTNSGDWARVTVDSASSVGAHASLALVDGAPAIAYYDAGNADLKYARAADALGASWPAGNVLAIDAGPEDRGRYSSLGVFGGRPGIGYHDATTGKLLFLWADDAQGSSWPAANLVTVDGDSTAVGSYASMAVVNGMPGIAYHESSPNLDLKFASLPAAGWSASTGKAQPILASGVKQGAVTTEMLGDEIGVWERDGDDLVATGGKVGIGRLPAKNTLEVEGTASKTTAGNWAANSDRRIKTDVREVTGAVDTLQRVRLVSFHYTEEYRRQHPAIADERYLNVIAQEFAEVFPRHVRGSGERLPDGSEILQVDTYPLVIYAAAAVQELHGELEETRSELDDLRARLEALEARGTEAK